MKADDEKKVARTWRDLKGRVRCDVSPPLAAHRGWQVGVHDAYKWLLPRHQTAAKELREAFGMSPDGSISLSYDTDRG